MSLCREMMPPWEMKAEMERLTADNERLRAALELFACDCIESGDLCHSPQNCRNYTARAALSTTETRKGTP